MFTHYTTHYTLNNTHRTLHNTLYTLHITHYTLYRVNFTHYTRHIANYTLHFTHYTLQTYSRLYTCNGRAVLQGCLDNFVRPRHPDNLSCNCISERKLKSKKHPEVRGSIPGKDSVFFLIYRNLSSKPLLSG